MTQMYGWCTSYKEVTMEIIIIVTAILVLFCLYNQYKLMREQEHLLFLTREILNRLPEEKK